MSDLQLWPGPGSKVPSHQSRTVTGSQFRVPGQLSVHMAGNWMKQEANPQPSCKVLLDSHLQSQLLACADVSKEISLISLTNLHNRHYHLVSLKVFIEQRESVEFEGIFYWKIHTNLIDVTVWYCIHWLLTGSLTQSGISASPQSRKHDKTRQSWHDIFVSPHGRLGFALAAVYQPQSGHVNVTGRQVCRLQRSWRVMLGLFGSNYDNC